MSAYHDAPFTLEAETVIPEDALPAVGVDAYGHADAVQAASAEYGAEDKVTFEATVTGRTIDVTVNPATDFEEGFTIDYDFGDHEYELGADDLDQHHTYQSPGDYVATAVVRQPGRPTLQFSAPVSIE